jgi:cellulose synthase/poly-beta-1,6-N-acetylglucosamine synthase-like glycosyltransferase
MPGLDLVIITILYLLQVGVLLYGLRRTKDNAGATFRPFVSVVIAARNEEINLPECLDSLVRQTYPADKFEVIIADDGSTDQTAAVCTEYARMNANIKPFHTVENPHLPGKPNALDQAINRAQGEVVMITDADCTVPPTWIEATAQRYTPEVGLVGGMTLQRTDTAFHGMQSLDWAYILGVASSSAALGTPLGSIGNNLSFRKKAYDEVGGYGKIKFSITEDYSLVQAILGTEHWKFLYPIDERVLVESKPCPTLRSLLQQKHRWGKGGLDMKFWGFVIMAIGFSMHALLLWHFVWSSLAATGIILLVKMIADYTFLSTILARLKKTDELRYFYWFELYYTLYVLALPFLVFFGGKVRWKGRIY